MFARPGLNGNTKEHFEDVYVRLIETEVALIATIRYLHTYVLHGRNYQTLEKPDQARGNDIYRLVKPLNEAVDALRQAQHEFEDILNPL